MLKKTLLTLCISTALSQGASAGRCFDVADDILYNNADLSAVNELSRLKDNIKKYFSIVGEREEVPTVLSWDEAWELARFLQVHGHDIRVFDNEDNADSRSLWGKIIGYPIIGGGFALILTGAERYGFWKIAKPVAKNTIFGILSFMVGISVFSFGDALKEVIAKGRCNILDIDGIARKELPQINVDSALP